MQATFSVELFLYDDKPVQKLIVMCFSAGDLCRRNVSASACPWDQGHGSLINQQISDVQRWIKKDSGMEHMMISKCIGIGPKFEVKPESNVFSHRVRRASVQDGVDVER